MKQKTKIHRFCIYTALGVIGFIVGTQVSAYQYRYRTPSQIEQEGSGKLSDFFSTDNLSGLFSKTVKKPDLAQEFKTASSKYKGVIGWLYIENTRINYPIMHGEGNSYYLNRGPDGNASYNGSIFLDEAETGFNKVSVLHGHNMLDGSMFSDLHNYYRVETQKQNNAIYLYDGVKERKFMVISILRVSSSYNLKLNIEDDNEVQKYANELSSSTLYSYGTKITSKPLIILNTCFSDGTNDHLLVVGQEV